MSNYNEIHGTTVRNSAGNLSGAATGELFYDSTNRDFKYSYPNVSSSWRTGNDLNTGRQEINKGSSGTQTSALAFGGTTPPRTAITESYNGTSWTEVSDLNLARYGLSGAGTTTAGLAFGGSVDPGDKGETESWNGSSWTEVNDLNTGDAQGAGFGTATAALAVKMSTVEQFNGTSWTEVADTATPRGSLQAAKSGTTTEGLVFGGDGVIASTEEWLKPGQITVSFTVS